MRLGSCQLQTTIRCRLRLLGQNMLVTLVSGYLNGDTQQLNLGTVFCTHTKRRGARSKCLSLQIKITFLCENPFYASNRTMFFTYEWLWFEVLESQVNTRLYTIRRSNLYSFCEVVRGCKAMQSK